MASDQALIDGLTRHAATLLSLLVGGSAVMTSDLVAVLQARIAAIKLAIAARASFMDAVAATPRSTAPQRSCRGRGRP